MSAHEERPWPPYYFSEAAGLYQPSGLARSPWDRRAIAGGPVSALLATGAEDQNLDTDFEIARLTVDILGKVPHQPLRLDTEALRDGRQTKLHRTVILANDRIVAQAHVLRVRRSTTPAFEPPHEYPAPETVTLSTGTGPARMAGAILHRPILGGPGQPGRGIAWLAMNGQIVAGISPSPFVKAAMFADFGNGFGNATPASEWSYANLDISLQFLRMPAGEWLLIDAETHMAGNGHGTARSTFADASGVYARGLQTIFVAPGHLSEQDREGPRP